MSDDSTQPSNPFASRGFIAAAIVIGVILLAGVVVLVTALTAPHTPVAQPTSTPSGPVASGDDKSVCGLKGFETESSLTAAPTHTKWELVGTVATPTDPNGPGPGRIDSDGFRSCFAHTAAGALYASVNFIALGTDGTLRPRLTELVADGPGKDAIASSDPNAGSDSARAQLAGFKVDSYDGGSATVDLALNYNTGDLVSVPIKLVWEAGDWKLVLAEDGSLPLKPAQLQSLGGYIPWAGA